MANASDIVRVGIIGCGGIANGKHMPALKKVPGVQMVAFCDIIEERAQKAKKDYGTPDAAVYTDYKKLLEDKTIDVVHVLTPNRAHSFITVDALEAGKHVMCEKPMAINSEEAKKMLDAAEKSGKLLTIGYQTRQTAQAQYLKAESEMGTFGDIYFARACAVRRRAVPTWGVFLNEYEQGGGPPHRHRYSCSRRNTLDHEQLQAEVLRWYYISRSQQRYRTGQRLGQLGSRKVHR